MIGCGPSCLVAPSAPSFHFCLRGHSWWETFPKAFRHRSCFLESTVSSADFSMRAMDKGHKHFRHMGRVGWVLGPLLCFSSQNNCFGSPDAAPSEFWGSTWTPLSCNTCMCTSTAARWVSSLRRGGCFRKSWCLLGICGDFFFPTASGTC